MAASNKRQSREHKRLQERMEAKQQLREHQGKRRLRDNIFAVAAVVVLVGLAVVLQVMVFAHNPSSDEVKAAEDSIKTSTPQPTPSGSAASSDAASLPPVPPASEGQGKTFTGTLTLNDKPVGVELDGTKAPQAAAVFKTLADANYFANKPCHRVTTGDNFAVLQCGALNDQGASAPNFSWGPIENAPADNFYPAGTIAVARVGDKADSQGTQFFITYKDTNIPADSAGGYTVVGKVTSGLDVVSAIGAAGVKGGGNDGAPASPVTVNSFTLK